MFGLLGPLGHHGLQADGAAGHRLGRAEDQRAVSRQPQQRRRRAKQEPPQRRPPFRQPAHQAGGQTPDAHRKDPGRPRKVDAQQGGQGKAAGNPKQSHGLSPVLSSLVLCGPDGPGMGRQPAVRRAVSTKAGSRRAVRAPTVTDRSRYRSGSGPRRTGSDGPA